MLNVINEYLSERPARFFEEISAIPRASLQEERIADYLVKFAIGQGLYCYRDEANNVLIRKAGSPGREKEPPLLLQAHSDMVTEVAFGVAHDFTREGVSLCREGNILRARNTTLGADDGFGVALMLAVLEGGAPSHPPLECLFTAAEEIGLVGAGKFDYSLLSARRMLNFDSAEEHLIITGCCGGIRTSLTLPVSFESVSGKGLRIALHGLCGGHSGEDIHKGRGNALILMGQVLSEVGKISPFRLTSVSGGDKTNAIPRDCEVVILPDDLSAVWAFLEESEALLSRLVTSSDDRARSLQITPVDVTSTLSAADTHRIMEVLRLPNGVLAYRKDGKTPPETSRNLANVRTKTDCFTFELSSRSPLEEKLDASIAELDALAMRLGGACIHRSRYPGWEGAEDSPVCACWRKAYCRLTGKLPATTVIHAGLECGLIRGALKELDVISVGCNIYDLHTPAERMELDSLERIYRTLIAFLEDC